MLTAKSEYLCRIVDRMRVMCAIAEIFDHYNEVLGDSCRYSAIEITHQAIVGRRSRAWLARTKRAVEGYYAKIEQAAAAFPEVSRPREVREKLSELDLMMASLAGESI